MVNVGGAIHSIELRSLLKLTPNKHTLVSEDGESFDVEGSLEDLWTHIEKFDRSDMIRTIASRILGKFFHANCESHKRKRVDVFLYHDRYMQKSDEMRVK